MGSLFCHTLPPRDVQTHYTAYFSRLKLDCNVVIPWTICWLQNPTVYYILNKVFAKTKTVLNVTVNLKSKEHEP